MTTQDQTFNKLSDKRNLYLIYQNINTGYDTFSDAIVAAWSEEEARHTHPCGSASAWADHGESWFDWVDPKDVTVLLIGIAEPGLKGVMCASFHAG